MINYIINFILLSITGKIMGAKRNTLRLSIASGFGGIYACFIFFPTLSAMYTLLSKILISVIITKIAFSCNKVVVFIKLIAVFYISSFLLGGVTFFVIFLTDIGENISGMANNGVIYFNLPWKVLFASTGICYILIRFAGKFFSSRKGTIYKEVKINFNSKSVVLMGVIDTGNALVDPFSDKPVIVCELKMIEKILPTGMKEFFYQKTDEKLLSEGYENIGRIRMIPYNSIGKENGILMGFCADSIHVEGKVYENITVGVHQRPLSAEENYSVLLGPQFIK